MPYTGWPDFTGRAGTALSTGGNIIPGYGGKVAGAIALTGVSMGQVGPEYDFAMGFDPGLGTARMFGYCLAEKGTWEESTQLQDVQRMIQTASGSTTDRDLVRWPKVSQGDWSTGERQVVLIDPTRYYLSDGQVDVTMIANLTLLPSPATAFSWTATALGGMNRFPLACDGDQWYLGLPSGVVKVGHRDGTVTDVVVPGGLEIADLLEGLADGTPGVWAANSGGIWFINGMTYAVTQWVSGPVEIKASPCMAYINGRLYYVVGGGHTINYVAVAGVTAGTAGNTNSNMEGYVRSLTAQAAGLIWSTGPDDQPGVTPQGYSLIWTAASDITGVSRVGLIPGIIKYMSTSAGVTYIQAHLYESTTPLQYNPTLYTWNGTSLTVYDDMRYALDDFKAVLSGVPNFSCSHVYGDGRFVYLAWPGLQGIQLDLIAPSKGTGLSRIAGKGLPGTNVLAHRIVRTSYHGYVDLAVNSQGGSVTTYNKPPSSGTITSSYYDFNTPGLVKAFRSFDIDLSVPLPVGSSVSVAFQADASSTWTPMTLNNYYTTNLVAYFPPGTEATRVRYQVTLTAGAGGSPVIRAWSTKANLGRVWRATVSCKRVQQTNASADDQQGALAQDLIANIENAYNNAGRCILYISSPRSKGTEQVQASLEDYKWVSTKPSSRQSEQGAYDIEGDVEVTFVEIL